MQHTNHEHQVENRTENAAATSATSLKNQRLMNDAKYWLCGGVGLLATSFGVNFLLADSAATDTITTSMYIMTTLGSICLTKALVNIFN
ncbi:MAG: hypothetical protein IT269_10875 [Saprospiraceae bacterium]|nr:hypothetical protein [Saprospiraceae bacterium]